MDSKRLSAAVRARFDDRMAARMDLYGQEIVKAWRAAAKRELNTSAAAYARSIGIESVTRNSVTVTMPAPGTSEKDARLAKMVEHGMGPGGIGTQGAYDIRKFMLNKGKIKQGVNGPYVDIPFARRGRKSDVKGALEIARIGNRSTLSAARRLAPRTSTSAGASLSGGLAGKIKSKHVSDALQGLRRTASLTAKGTMRTTGFVLWRRMSWNSTDPDAWTSPGIKAHNLARTIDKQVPSILRKAT
mgnify:FL=1